MWSWQSAEHGGNNRDPPLVWTSTPDDLISPCDIKQLINDREAIWNPAVDWHHYVVVQFWCEPHEDAEPAAASEMHDTCMPPQTPPRPPPGSERRSRTERKNRATHSSNARNVCCGSSTTITTTTYTCLWMT